MCLDRRNTSLGRYHGAQSCKIATAAKLCAVGKSVVTENGARQEARNTIRTGSCELLRAERRRIEVISSVCKQVYSRAECGRALVSEIHAQRGEISIRVLTGQRRETARLIAGAGTECIDTTGDEPR